MPNWRTLEAKDRLLAAVIAAHPDKKLLDYRKIATFFGQGTTYDSIEGQFRIIRREAARLREAVESGEHEEAPPRNRTAPVAKNTAKAHIAKKTGAATSAAVHSGVINGRINKGISPSKAKRAAPSAAVLSAAPGISPLRFGSPDHNDVQNRIYGIKEENFSTDNSVIEIDDDDDDGNVPSYHAHSDLSSDAVARSSVERGSFGPGLATRNTLRAGSTSFSSLGNKSVVPNLFDDHVFGGDADVTADDGDGDGDPDGETEHDFLSNWTVPFP